MKLHQIQQFLYNEGNINKMIKQPIEWEKISANHISDKGFISKTYKQLIQIKSKK